MNAPISNSSPDESKPNPDPHHEPALDSRDYAGKLPKIVPFDALARCGDEIWIENNGQIYRLRRTKQGKLILTK